jgi:hypothetical protein
MVMATITARRTFGFYVLTAKRSLPTRGGGNKGRVVERTTGGFALRPEGRRAYVMLVEPGHVTVSVKPLKK